MKPPLARRPWLRLAAIPLLGLVALVAPARAAEHSLPLVLPAGNEALEGFVRIVNRSDRSGEVEIRAVDDAGKEFGPISLSIGADSSPPLQFRGPRVGQRGQGSLGRSR